MVRIVLTTLALVLLSISGCSSTNDVTRTPEPISAVATPLVWAVDTALDPIGSPSERAGGQFGASLSLEGDLLAVGTPLHTNLDGAIFVFRDTPSSATKRHDWKLIDTLDDPNRPIDGVPLIRGDRIFVGTVRDVAIYEKQGDRWTNSAALMPVTQGWSFAIISGAAPIATANNQLVLNAPLATDADGNYVGSVFVFTEDAISKSWSKVELAYPAPAAITTLGAVAFDGETIAIGAGTYVAIWRRDAANSWKLDAVLNGLAEQQAFGSALAFDQGTLLVSSPDEGAVIIFERRELEWVETKRLVSPGGPRPDGFASSLAVRDGVLLVSAPARDSSGAVFEYRRTAPATWTLEREIIPPDASSLGSFGVGLAINAGATEIAIGAPQFNGRTGAVYLFSLARSRGETCTNAADCASGFCVDGFCCDTACKASDDANDCLSCAIVPGECTVMAAESVCRSATSTCDVVERCDGVSPSCPHDAVVANGTTCENGACVAGTCVANSRPSSDGDAPRVDPVSLAASGSTCSIERSKTSPLGSVAAVIPALFFLLLWRRRRRLSRFVAGCIFLVALTERAAIAAPTPIWFEKSRISSATSLQSIELYGARTALDGNDLAISSSIAGDNFGSVTFYRREGAGWVPRGQFAGDTQNVAFGYAVALHENVAVVSAPFSPNGGELFVYERASSTAPWSFKTKLAAVEPLGVDALGLSLDVFGDTIVAGAPFRERDSRGFALGAAFVFRRSPQGVWAESAVLPPDPARRYLGTRVVITETTLAMSAVIAFELFAPPEPAAVFIYGRESVASDWVLEQIIDNQAQVAPTTFGRSIALDGNRLLVGCDQWLFGPSFGRAYTYKRESNGSPFVFDQQLLVGDGVPNDGFGGAVALRGDRAFVSAPLNADGRGKVYAFEHDGLTWVERDALSTTELNRDDVFGTQLVMPRATGNPADDVSLLVTSAHAGGAVHLYARGDVGQACAANDACPTGACVDGVCCDSPCAGGEGDCQACSVAAGARVDGRCSPRSASSVCRAAVDDCDVSEVCDGQERSCPRDRVVPNGLECHGPNQSIANGTCSGGRCLAVIERVVVDGGTRSSSSGSATTPNETDTESSSSACVASPAFKPSSPKAALFALLIGIAGALARRHGGRS